MPFKCSLSKIYKLCGFGAAEGLEKSASLLLPDASTASSVAQTSPRTDPTWGQSVGEGRQRAGTGSRRQTALDRLSKSDAHREDGEKQKSPCRQTERMAILSLC